jgi:hypothetical protein
MLISILICIETFVVTEFSTAFVNNAFTIDGFAAAHATYTGLDIGICLKSILEINANNNATLQCVGSVNLA